MNLRRIILLPVLAVAATCSFFSCGEDRWPEYAPLIAVDQWMYETMQQDYLWYEDLPAFEEVNLFSAPDAFLSKIKSSKDHYSLVDSVMENPSPSYGFDYSLINNPAIDTAYNALITYIAPHSPADKAGLKRGEWIVKVGNSYISKKYETRLLRGAQPLTLTIGNYQKIEPTPGEQEEEGDIYDVVPVREGVSVGAAQVLEESPIHLHQTITLSNGSKVGYLVYNHFTAGTASDPEKYNDQLRDISAQFGNAGIRTLILDLRYNKGGTMGCAQLMSTLLAPASFLDQTMGFLEYNDKNTSKNRTLTFDRQLLKHGMNLDLDAIIFIAGGTTAGAGEMVINSLNGKTQALVLIGSATKGQNVATERKINEVYRWSVSPVVCTVYNSGHETQSGGFAPTYSVTETSDYTQYLPLGNPNEIMLNRAIGVLEGTYPPASGRSLSRNTLHTRQAERSNTTRIPSASGLRID